MPNISKETEEVVQKIKELAAKSYNEKRISEEIGLARGTIKRIAKKNNISLSVRIAPETKEKTEKFIELIKSGKTLTESRKEVGLATQTAHDIIKKYDLRHLVRNRKEAALDKILSLEEASSRLPQNSGTVIEYNQAKNKYVVMAPDGYIYYKLSSKLFQGDPRGKNGTKLTEENISSRLAIFGYEFIPDSFSIKRKPLKAKHLKCGNIRETRLANFEFQDCPTCANTGVSKEETELNEFVKSLGLKTEKYKFKERITRPQEIDIYSPETKIGIEYCGLYHHGERAGKDKKYHRHKLDMATSEGIQLLTVFSNEWIERKEQVKGFIRSKLSKNENTIFARKTKIKELNAEIAHNFLDSYHIQGSTRIQAAFGLFIKEELVAVVSGAEHHRISGQFTLNRLCFKSNYSIVGGASKLNKALCFWAKNHGYNKIVTWSDNRWSVGNVYSAMGYTKEEELGPDYFYSDGGKARSKQSCQKKHLLERGATGNTEKEMALSLGYDRIWDCGKKRWIIKI